MQGFYGVTYQGVAGAGALGLLLHKGAVVGMDAGGGDVSGTYTERPDGGIDLAMSFSWAAGTVLVTGQTLPSPMTVKSDVSISAATLAGGTQPVDLPVGRVNVRVAKKYAI